MPFWRSYRVPGVFDGGPHPRLHAGAGLDRTRRRSSPTRGVAFTPDGSRLLVTTKANGTTSTCPGRLRRLLSASRWSRDRRVPFAVSFDRHGHVLIAERGPTPWRRSRSRQRNAHAVATALTASRDVLVVRAGRYFYASNAARVGERYAAGRRAACPRWATPRRRGRWTRGSGRRRFCTPDGCRGHRRHSRSGWRGLTKIGRPPFRRAGGEGIAAS